MSSISFVSSCFFLSFFLLVSFSMQEQLLSTVYLCSIDVFFFCLNDDGKGWGWVLVWDGIT